LQFEQIAHWRVETLSFKRASKLAPQFTS